MTHDIFYRSFIDNRSQVADILEECLKDFADDDNIVVRQATFSISEEFIRRIYRIKKNSNARFILCIDRKALQKTRQLWRFLSKVYDEIYLADSHAKLLLVQCSIAGKVRSVITSQNLTRGNRFESSFISSDINIFNDTLSDFNNIIKFHSVPMHEIMPVADADNVSVEKPQSESQLVEQIEELAAIFMPISDIAVILEINQAELREAIADNSSPIALAYAKGKAKAKAKIRAQEMQLAQLGSPLGVQNVKDNLIDMEADE